MEKLQYLSLVSKVFTDRAADLHSFEKYRVLQTIEIFDSLH